MAIAFRSAIAFIFLLIICSSGAAKAIPPDKPLSVVGLPYAPYIITQKDGSVGGIVVDLIREAAKRNGTTVKFNISNWPRAFKNAKHGNADALIPTMKSPDREVFFHYPNQQLLNLDMVLVKKRGRAMSYDGSMSSLEPYRIARVSKARVSPEFDKAREAGRIEVTDWNSNDLSIKAVAFSRVDLAASDRYSAIWSAQNQNVVQEIELLNPVLGSVPVYLAFSKASVSNELVEHFDKALKEIHSDGTFLKILRRYLGKSTGALLEIQ